MKEERTSTGILIRQYVLGDSSLILHWFTKEDGHLKTVAKGAKRPKSPFYAQATSFLLADIRWLTSTRSDLCQLLSLHAIEDHAQIGKHYSALMMAAYFTSLLEHWVIPDQPEPALFDLFRRALAYLNDKRPTMRALTHFERELSNGLGYSSERSEVSKLFLSERQLASSRQALINQLRALE